MQQSKQFHIHKDQVIAFCRLLEQAALPNTINAATEDGIIITVMYFADDLQEQQYIDELSLFDTDVG